MGMFPGSGTQSEGITLFKMSVFSPLELLQKKNSLGQECLKLRVRLNAMACRTVSTKLLRFFFFVWIVFLKLNT